MKKLLILMVILPSISFSQINIINKNRNPEKHFSIATKNSATSIFYDDSENILVKKSAEFLASDIKKVSYKKPQVHHNFANKEKKIILLGTLGKNALIEKLIAEKKINVDAIKGQWESFIIQTIDNPFDGVEECLVILGSDRRGLAYGVFTLSKKMGVSPWYWWADVPIKQKEEIYLEKCNFVSKSPKIKYRGIFINDERPSMAKWVYDKFGGWNHKFYEKVYELLLRNRANFLWPAMWYEKGSDWNVPAFYADDPENHRLADEYGIVMSTSHHEPMMRAHHEWHRGDNGEWDYSKNSTNLKEFWRGGIKRMGNYESVITLGMRGDGDWDIPGGMQTSALQKILKDQREIIKNVTGKPANETPQVWAVYKEVQNLYDQGLRPADDVTILFCDDNWGNIKSLPKKEDLHRKGGFGIYYHFDYVGSPRSYKWANVTQIERVWEQMNLAYERGAKELWIANVGDIKPHEFPMSFWFDYAWNPEAISANKLPNYYTQWAEQQFGAEYAEEIGKILSLYTKYNSRRTPEMLEPTTYSLENYREADRVVKDFKRLNERTIAVSKKLPKKYQSSFYQLVRFPVESCANLNEMLLTAAKNKFYVDRGAAHSASKYAKKTTELFFKDEKFHKTIHSLENGKWNHMFNQTHIGQKHWHSSTPNNMPPISYTHASGKSADLAYSIEYGKGWTTFEPFDGIANKYHSSFSTFDNANKQEWYINIFNKGDEKLHYKLAPKQDWIQVSKKNGELLSDEKVFVSINWEKAPKGKNIGTIELAGSNQSFIIEVPIRNDISSPHGFIENMDVISIEAENYDKSVHKKDHQWLTIPNLGRTSSSVTISPSNTINTPITNQPKLGTGDYDIILEAEQGNLGEVWKVHTKINATEDKYIEISPDLDHNGNSPAATSSENIASYNFTVSKTGLYNFNFRMLSDNAHDDSFFWRVDEGKWILENGRYGKENWFSSKLGELEKGKHLLQIAYRENKTQLDKFIFQYKVPTKFNKNHPHLAYTFTTFDIADVEVSAYLSPSYNFNRDDGLKFAISIDDEIPQIVNLHEGSNWWSNRVSNHIAIKKIKHKKLVKGTHTLKIWAIDDGVVFQKFVINTGGAKPSYLGAPKSIYIKK